MEGLGEGGDQCVIFAKLCEKKSWTDIACMLVESGSMNPNSTFTGVRAESPILGVASLHGRLNVVKALLQGFLLFLLQQNQIVSLMMIPVCM